jgi:hypothetical protein
MIFGRNRVNYYSEHNKYVYVCLIEIIILHVHLHFFIMKQHCPSTTTVKGRDGGLEGGE